MKKVTLKLQLKTLMTERGLTQDQLSVKAKVPQGTISRWAGNKVDSYQKEVLEKLMIALDCSLEDLFTIEVSEEGE
jgi:transcriptional regulator with XRE-family HTH domain